MTPGVAPVSLGRIQIGYRHSTGLLLANTWPSLTLRKNLLSSKNTTDCHPAFHPPMSSGLTPLASQTAMAWSRLSDF
ncbi:hypothetical protein TNCV_4577461 [Trichonephila clavipes]|nr:hypothetical protein TNCV_4577461 [Trichonephila clavipes]